jgi:hypothetical protein
MNLQWRAPERRGPGRAGDDVVDEDDTGNIKNNLFHEARLRRPSPCRPGKPMSRKELADLVNQLVDERVHDGPVTANHIGKIERGVSSYPPAHRRAAYRSALQVDSDLDIGLIDRRPRPVDERPLQNVVQQTDPGESGPTGGQDIKRRTLVVGALAKFGLLALAPSAATEDDVAHLNAAIEDAQRYLDLDVVKYLHGRLSACAEVDGISGPSAALPIALGVIAVVNSRAKQVKEGVRRELLAVGARGAELAGWLYRDAGAPDLAEYWRDRSSSWGCEAAIFAMPGYILVKKSQAAWDQRNAPRMLDLVQTVQAGPWQLPAVVRAEAAQQEARAHAMLTRDMEAVRKCMSKAQEFMAAQRESPATDQVAQHYGKSLFAVQAAICNAEVGHLDEAIEQYDSALSPTLFSRRDYGYFLTLNAQTLTLAGQPERAANAGQTAHAVAVSAGSRRTLNELKRLRLQLRPWRDRPAVQSFRRLMDSSIHS